MNQNQKDIRRVKRARVAVIVALATLAVGLLAFPAIGYYVDTRVFPGGPPVTVEERDAFGKVIDIDTYDNDTISWAWFVVPYSIYAFLGIIIGAIAWADAVSDSRRRTGMNSIWSPLPEVKQLTTNTKAEKVYVERDPYDPLHYR